MKKLHLTFAAGDYEFILPLKDGTVQPEGIELTVLTMPSPERSWRMRQGEFDVVENSLSMYVANLSRQGSPWIALPAYLHRRFRHSYIFVHAESGIRQPRDLEGRTVGLRFWSATAGVWARGILREHYGVQLENIDWVARERDGVPDLRLSRYRLRQLPEDQDMMEAFFNREIDALIYPEVPPAFKEGDPRIRQLFNDPQREEAEYFRKTGIFPIMHVTLIRRSLYERYPWVAVSLLRALREAKDIALKKLRDPRRVPLPWIEMLWLQSQRLLGPDPWDFSVDGSRRCLETFLRYAVDQELASPSLTVDDLFAPTVLTEPPQYFGRRQ